MTLSTMKRILILEDDHTLATEIRDFFYSHQYECHLVHEGAGLFKALADFHPDILILDINVPLINGLEVCKILRERGIETPILMLTAYSSVENKVDALEFGADDYMVKPFHFDELHARVKALLRRSSKSAVSGKESIEIGDLKINVPKMEVTRNGQVIPLTPKEYKLLELLATHYGQPISKQVIAEKVWGINFETGTNTVEVYINFLRNKVDKGYNEKLIHTRQGYGYYLKHKDIP